MARRPSNSPETIANVLRLLPAKWVIGLLVVVLLYYFAQPRLNAWFGWHLPTIAAMTGQEEPAKVSRSSNSKSPSPTASNSSTGRASQTTKPSPSSKPGPTTKIGRAHV